MNLCVSDGQVVINIQGIRYVKWGETTANSYNSPGRPWFVTVTYKGNHETFQYKTEGEAREIFYKIREAMDKTFNFSKREGTGR